MPARRLLLACSIVAAAGLNLAAADPLHARIDAIIDAAAKAEKLPVSGPADDGEFLRRVTLDFAGRVPTAAEARAFLDDKATDKRAKKIDALLAGPHYAARMADLFNVMLMERNGENADWQKWLAASFAENKPWDQMAKQILRADPKDEANRGAGFWLARRLLKDGQNPIEYSALTKDVGRLFLGKNFQCCECHDHLFIDDYKQQHFQALHTFFKNTTMNGPTGVTVGLTTGKTTFASVFTKVEMMTFPGLPTGQLVEVPAFKPGEEYAVPPDRKTKNPGEPKFNSLEAVANVLPTAKNRDFVVNAANRLWFVLMGRGIVHPLDLHHSGNPASHPELLELLADELAAHQFDIKYLFRAIALSKAYQRSSVAPAGAEPAEPKWFVTANEKRLSAEQMTGAILVALGEEPRLTATGPEGGIRARVKVAYVERTREPEDDVAPSLKAALFLLNEGDLLNLMKPRPGNLGERLTKAKDSEVADELYLSVLCRRPTAEERATVAKVWARHADKSQAAFKLTWALMASMEFGVNH